MAVIIIRVSQPPRPIDRRRPIPIVRLKRDRVVVSLVNRTTTQKSQHTLTSKRHEDKYNRCVCYIIVWEDFCEIIFWIDDTVDGVALFFFFEDASITVRVLNTFTKQRLFERKKFIDDTTANSFIDIRWSQNYFSFVTLFFFV